MHRRTCCDTSAIEMLKYYKLLVRDHRNRSAINRWKLTMHCRWYGETVAKLNDHAIKLQQLMVTWPTTTTAINRKCCVFLQHTLFRSNFMHPVDALSARTGLRNERQLLIYIFIPLDMIVKISTTLLWIVGECDTTPMFSTSSPIDRQCIGHDTAITVEISVETFVRAMFGDLLVNIQQIFSILCNNLQKKCW